MTGISLASSSANVTVNGNTVNVSGGSPNNAFSLGGISLTAGSTGNVVAAGHLVGSLAVGSNSLGFAGGTVFP